MGGPRIYGDTLLLLHQQGDSDTLALFVRFNIADRAIDKFHKLNQYPGSSFGSVDVPTQSPNIQPTR